SLTSEFPLAWLPEESSEISVVWRRSRSYMKMSYHPFVSPSTSSAALDEKNTNRPSAEIFGFQESPSPSAPLEATDTRVVVPSSGSGTNTAAEWFVSSPGGSRLVAAEAKAT